MDDGELERVVVRRQTSLDYLKRCHTKSMHFLNVARLVGGVDERKGPAAARAAEAEDAALASRWVALGMSVAQIAQMASGEEVVRACAQLREEYLYYAGKDGVSSAPPPPVLASRSDSSGRVPGAAVNFDLVEPVRADIVRTGGRGSSSVLYRCLHTPVVPFGAADMQGVVFSVCEVLSLLYSKFLDPVCAAPALADAVQKFDAMVQEEFIEPLVERLTAEAVPAIDAELDKLSEFVGRSTGRRIAMRRSASRSGKGSDAAPRVGEPEV